MPGPRRGGGGGDKKSQFYEAIVSQKLQQVRWGVANAGVAPATRNDDGYTTFMLAADNGKDRSLAELIRWYERRLNQLRECLTQVEDETGRTCMHMACAHPNGVKAVQELLDAWLRVDPKRRDAGLKAKDHKGKTPFDVAKGKTKELLEEWLAPEEEDDDDDDEADDGLTSTQRSKLKKRNLMAAERAGNVSLPPPPPDDEENDEDATASPPVVPTSTDDDATAVTMSEPRWPEVEAWFAAVKNLRPIYELSVAKEDEELPEGVAPVDPALWRCTTLNRLQLKLGPRLTSLPAAGLAKLANLTILILAGHSLAELPASLGDLPLKNLDASRNKLQRLPPKMPGKTLEALDVSGNDLADLTPLADCANLCVLTLDANPRLADLALPYADLKRLVSLSACSCAIASLDPDLGKLAKLEVLALNSNPLTALPPTLAACKKLKDLKVDNTAISDNKVLGYIQKGEMKQLAKYFEKQQSSGKGGTGKKGKR